MSARNPGSFPVPSKDYEEFAVAHITNTTVANVMDSLIVQI